jgi:hypothetical protein
LEAVSAGGGSGPAPQTLALGLLFAAAPVALLAYAVTHWRAAF